MSKSISMELEAFRAPGDVGMATSGRNPQRGVARILKPSASRGLSAAGIHRIDICSKL